MDIWITTYYWFLGAAFVCVYLNGLYNAMLYVLCQAKVRCKCIVYCDLTLPLCMNTNDLTPTQHTQLNGRAEIGCHAIRNPLTHILSAVVCVHVHIYENSYLCIFHLFVPLNEPS